MKKFFMMAVMAVCALAANAQTPAAGSITVTPKVGINVATLTNDADYSLDSKVGFTAGAEGLYMFDDMLGISAGVMYSQQGAKGSGMLGDAKLNNDYINVPVMVNSYLANGFAVKLGVQAGFNVNNKIKVEGESVDPDDLGALGEPFKVNSVDISIPVGVSYEYANVVLDARYNWGVSNIFKADGLKGHNSVFQITLGYRF